MSSQQQHQPPSTSLEEADAALLARLLPPTRALVASYMSRYDASHDAAHIDRVVATATRLAAAHPTPLRNPIVLLSAYLHDVGDAKYATPDDDPAPALALLLSIGASRDLAEAVQTVVSHVSFSKEKKDPAAVARVLETHPELAVVQDADRLDALGAVGVARCFVYGATRAEAARAAGTPETRSCIDSSVAHFGDKLEGLEGLMKTERGRQMARVGTERIKLFKSWWLEETSGSL